MLLAFSWKLLDIVDILGCIWTRSRWHCSVLPTTAASSTMQGRWWLWMSHLENVYLMNDERYESKWSQFANKTDVVRQKHHGQSWCNHGYQEGLILRLHVFACLWSDFGKLLLHIRANSFLKSCPRFLPKDSHVQVHCAQVAWAFTSLEYSLHISGDLKD